MKNRVRAVLLKVVARYLAKDEFYGLIKDIETGKRVTDPNFVKIIRKHFDFERWNTSPLIKQDIWLYNYFQYEFEGKLKCTGLLNKYIFSAFVYDDTEFFKNAERLNNKKTPLPKGVKFIPHENIAQVANHILSNKIEPGQVN